MTQRIARIESLVQQIVASSLPDFLEEDTPKVTVTGVDVSPDIRNAVVWIGVLADNDAARDLIFTRVNGLRGEMQRRLAAKVTTKFVPRLSFELDIGGRYAEHITRLLGNL